MPESSTLEPLATPPAGEPQTPTGGLPASPSWTDSDGNFSDKWLDRLPAEVVPPDAKPTLAKYRSLPELSKAHWNLQQQLGKKATAVQVPKFDSPPEEVAAYRKAVGVPEKIEEYNFKPDSLPKDYPWDDKGPLQSAIREIGYKHHIPPGAIKEMATAYTTHEAMMLEEALKASEEQIEKHRTELKDKWKGAYAENVKTATAVAARYGIDPEAVNTPAIMDLLVRVAADLSEDKIVRGGFNPSSTPGADRADAIQRGTCEDAAGKDLHRRYMEGDPEAARQIREMRINDPAQRRTA